MENHCFNQGHLKYLCILGYDDGEYDCYACETEDEVFKAISDRIFEEIKWITQDGTDFSHWEEYGDADTMDEVAEIKAYISMLKSQEVIKNPAILKDCYDKFFADCWWFTVLDECGDEWFGCHT